MSKQTKISLEDIDFSKVKGDDALMRVFVDFAFANPSQGDQLFNKYVAYLCRTHDISKEGAENVAASNIGYMAGYYKLSTARKLFKVYKAISHPMFGRIK